MAHEVGQVSTRAAACRLGIRVPGNGLDGVQRSTPDARDERLSVPRKVHGPLEDVSQLQ